MIQHGPDSPGCLSWAVSAALAVVGTGPSVSHQVLCYAACPPLTRYLHPRIAVRHAQKTPEGAFGTLSGGGWRGCFRRHSGWPWGCCGSGSGRNPCLRSGESIPALPPRRCRPRRQPLYPARKDRAPLILPPAPGLWRRHPHRDRRKLPRRRRRSREGRPPPILLSVAPSERIRNHVL